MVELLSGDGEERWYQDVKLDGVGHRNTHCYPYQVQQLSLLRNNEEERES